MKSKSPPTIKAISDVLTFGKYKGRTVQWIVENKPSYFVWIVDQDIVNLVEDEIYWMAQLNEQDDQERYHEYRFMSMWDFLHGDDF